MKRGRRFIQTHINQITLVAGLLIVGAFILRWFSLTSLSAIALAVAAIIAAVPVIIRAWSALRMKVISIELLVSVAVIGAFIIREYDEAAIVTFLFLFGTFLEDKTLAKTRQSIKTLTEMAPVTATIIQADGQERRVDVDDVDAGDVVVVNTGDQIPVDGTVKSGDGLVNEASVTGESRPVQKNAGSTVFAGTILENGNVQIEATKVGDDTTFAKIIELVDEAQDVKSPAEKFIDRFATYYTPAVLVIALLVGIVTRDFRLAITVLVLGCPGALVIGAPVSNVAGIGNGAKHGVLVKGGDVMNTLSKIDVLVFDKTGTLTRGNTVVTNVKEYGDAKFALGAAAMMEKMSNHPLGRAVVEYAENNIDTIPKQELKLTEIKGQGMMATVSGQSVLVGNEQLLKSQNVAFSKAQLDDLEAIQAAGNSVVLVAVASELRALIGIADEIRPDVADGIKQLSQMGITKTVMLTGDNEATAEAVASRIGIDEVQANLMPEDKVTIVKKLQQDGRKVAFVGDGINDSPSLATADIGIAMGAGTDVAIDVSDVVLMQSSFTELVHAIGLAKKTVANTRENIVIAVGTVALLFAGLMAGIIYMASGMFIHEASILVVILNAMRLIRFKTSEKNAPREVKDRELDLNQGSNQ